MIFVVLLGCLFPLAVYCLFLSWVNRRPHPVVVSGAWDCAGLLLGASGFLLVGGPFILAGFTHRWRVLWLLHPAFPSREGPGLLWGRFHLILWLGYFVTLVGGSIWLLRRRRCWTSIYNVSPAVVPEVLGQVLDRLRLEWTGAGDRVLIGVRSGVTAGAPSGEDLPAGGLSPSASGVPAAAVLPEEPAAGGGASPFSGGPVLVELEAFAVMRHVGLRWPAGAGELQGNVEADLARVLAEVKAPDNPAGRWLMTAAGSLFTLMFFFSLFLVIVSLLIQVKGGL